MKDKLIKIEKGSSTANLARDPYNNSVINTSTRDLEEAKKAKEKRMKSLELSERVDSLEKKMDKITDLLENLVENRK